MENARLNLENTKRGTAKTRALEAQASGNDQLAAAEAEKGGIAVPTAGYGDVHEQVKPDIDRVQKMIRNNNWSIAGNKDELRNLYQNVLARAKTLHASPQALALIEQDLKNTMRDALKENGLVFKSAGTAGVEQDYGL
jgi:hypothetical protein